jgi:glutathione synthase/RimK-type ligase-like ATP-grasp enzyme
MAAHLTMIQDVDQVMLYEDKSGQFAKWGDWMPDTWRFTNEADALAFAETAELPIISKADVGASSKNVRVITHRDQLVRHIQLAFSTGIDVHHCAGGFKSLQVGYVLLQRFVQHDITWRVNAIGRGRAIFKRYNYPDKPLAQTGNVEPVMRKTKEINSLLRFADRFFEHGGTQWCAVDILKDGDEWKILETSLAWPWPSPGQCNEAPIFRTGRVWSGMFEAMFDEVERGAWGAF